MEIEPANIHQIRMGSHGNLVEISQDIGGVADELRKIDPCLHVRFAENGNPPYWVIYHESEDHRYTSLVTTAQAYQNMSGTWEGLDQRLVERIRKIGHESYDYAAELQRIDEEAREASRAKFRNEVGETMEIAAHAIRKDLGERYRGRAFVPRDVA